MSNNCIPSSLNIQFFHFFRAKGLQFFGIDKDKVLFEIQAEDSGIRDQWVVSLNELLEGWKADPTKRPRSSVSAAGTSNKADYFQQREKEIADRAKENAEKKKKYSAGGMKFTAQAMLNRS